MEPVCPGSIAAKSPYHFVGYPNEENGGKKNQQINENKFGQGETNHGAGSRFTSAPQRKVAVPQRLWGLSGVVPAEFAGGEGGF